MRRRLPGAAPAAQPGRRPGGECGALMGLAGRALPMTLRATLRPPSSASSSMCSGPTRTCWSPAAPTQSGALRARACVAPAYPPAAALAHSLISGEVVDAKCCADTSLCARTSPCAAHMSMGLQGANQPDDRPCARSVDSPDAVLDAVLLHCLAHVGASAAAIKRNSERLKAGSSGAGSAPEVPRDQGFTRPKVCRARCMDSPAALHAPHASSDSRVSSSLLIAGPPPLVAAPASRQSTLSVCTALW